MSEDVARGEQHKDREKNSQELQMLEQNLQNILLQKQAFQIELRETQSALRELEKSGEEVFKIIGQLLIKTDKKSVVSELVSKEKMMELRITNFEKQERALSEKIRELQTEILK